MERQPLHRDCWSICVPEIFLSKNKYYLAQKNKKNTELNRTDPYRTVYRVELKINPPCLDRFHMWCERCILFFVLSLLFNNLFSVFVCSHWPKMQNHRQQSMRLSKNNGKTLNALHWNTNEKNEYLFWAELYCSIWSEKSTLFVELRYKSKRTCVKYKEGTSSFHFILIALIIK